MAIKSDEPLLVEATVQHEGDGDARSVKLRCESVRTLSALRMDSTRRVRLRLPATMIEPAMLDKLRSLLSGQSGGAPVEIQIQVGEVGHALVGLHAGFQPSPDDESISRVERILGRNAITFVG